MYIYIYISITSDCQELQPIPADIGGDMSKYLALTEIVGISEILYDSQGLIRILRFHLFSKFINLTSLSIGLLTGLLRFWELSPQVSKQV